MLRRLAVLADDRCLEPCGCATEHGFAAYVETDAARILFDTGAGDVLLPNAEALGVDLRSVDAVCLSHGHYDHTGGLAALLRLKGPTDVYCHPGAFRSRFAASDGQRRDVSMPLTRRELESLGARFHTASGPVNVAGCAWLTGAVPRLPQHPAHSDPRLQIDADGAGVPDPFPDDQTMFFVEDDRVHVLLGCTHSGLANTLAHIGALAPGKPLGRIIGGLHLARNDAELTTRVVDLLRDAEFDRLHPCHCTGEAAAEALVRDVGAERVEPIGVGWQWRRKEDSQ